MKKIKPLTIEDIQWLAHKLAREHMEWDEKIPDFSTRYPNILESCLITPFQSYDGNEFYPTLVKKAAILFYLLIKNHPFQNGNKRIAVTSLLVFLYLNKKWIEVAPENLYKFALSVARSRPRIKKGQLQIIKGFIEENIKDL